MDIIKVITILNYLSIKIKKISKLEAIKLLYYIDKEHLLKYGRFVTGDEYHKCPYGPVPTFILDFINDPEIHLEKEDLDYLNKFISFSSDKYRIMTSKEAPDLDELSDSEQEIIDFVLEKYSDFRNNLIDLTHDEYAYKETKGKIISYKDIAHDADVTKRDNIIKAYEEDIQNQKIHQAINNKANELIEAMHNETSG